MRPCGVRSGWCPNDSWRKGVGLLSTYEAPLAANHKSNKGGIMKQIIILRKAIVLLLCVLVVALIPWAAIAKYTGSERGVDRHVDVKWRVNTLVAMYAGSDGWEQQLTGFVIVQEGMASAKSEPGSFDPYLGQVALVRSLYDRGDWKGTYLAMNRFMDMLEGREGDITATAADAMWDFCYCPKKQNSLHVESRKVLIIQEYIKSFVQTVIGLARTKSVDRGAVGSNFHYKDAADKTMIFLKKMPMNNLDLPSHSGPAL